MAKIVALPKLSPSMEEAKAIRWAKREGDPIAVGDLMAEVDVDKVTVEWRAEEEGFLLKILIDEGMTLLPNTPVAIVGAEGEDVAELLMKVRAQSSGSARLKAHYRD